MLIMPIFPQVTLAQRVWKKAVEVARKKKTPKQAAAELAVELLVENTIVR